MKKLKFAVWLAWALSISTACASASATETEVPQIPNWAGAGNSEEMVDNKPSNVTDISSCSVSYDANNGTISLLSPSDDRNSFPRTISLLTATTTAPHVKVVLFSTQFNGGNYCNGLGERDFGMLNGSQSLHIDKSQDQPIFRLTTHLTCVSKSKTVVKDFYRTCNFNFRN